MPGVGSPFRPIAAVAASYQRAVHSRMLLSGRPLFTPHRPHHYPRKNGCGPDSLDEAESLL